MFDVEKIAKLARLKIDGDEVKTILPQLEEIIRYVEALNQIDTAEIDGYTRKPAPSGRISGIYAIPGRYTRKSTPSRRISGIYAIPGRYTRKSSPSGGVGASHADTVLRADEPLPPTDPQERLRLAPSQKEGMFFVPKVIGDGED